MHDIYTHTHTHTHTHMHVCTSGGGHCSKARREVSGAGEWESTHEPTSVGSLSVGIADARAQSCVWGHRCYVCACVCVCVCVCVSCMYLHTCIKLYACMYVCMYVCMYACMYACIHPSIHVCIQHIIVK